jgi:glycine/D-amino acid oxidase-like deaminating enzyme
MVHILGGGIAGLMLAERLGALGEPCRVYEISNVLGSEASGKNAGIVRTYETDPVIAHYAAQSIEYYRQNEPSFRECGLILRPWEVDYHLQGAPLRPLANHRSEGYYLQHNGVLEPLQVLHRIANSLGQSEIQFSFEAEILVASGFIKSLRDRLDHSRHVSLAPGDSIVVASGEGAVPIALKLGKNLGLLAHARTLYSYENITGYSGPVQWDEETGCYFRVDGETLLATAGEQIPVGVGDPVSVEYGDPERLEILAQNFPFLRAELLISQRSCKRLMPLDNRPYCGRDTDLANLFWFTGLGGRGISLAPALAAALAQEITGGTTDKQWSAFSPARANVS